MCDQEKTLRHTVLMLVGMTLTFTHTSCMTQGLPHSREPVEVLLHQQLVQTGQKGPKSKKSTGRQGQVGCTLCENNLYFKPEVGLTV